MEKQWKLYYAMRSLYESVKILATGAGSKTERLNCAYEYGLVHWYTEDKYLEAMSIEEGNILIALRKAISDIYKEYEKKYNTKPPANFAPLKYIHYKKADKIINLIIQLYEMLDSDLYTLKEY